MTARQMCNIDTVSTAGAMAAGFSMGALGSCPGRRAAPFSTWDRDPQGFGRGQEFARAPPRRQGRNQLGGGISAQRPEGFEVVTA